MHINPRFSLALTLIAPAVLSAQLNVSLGSNIGQTLPDLTGAVVYLVNNDNNLPPAQPTITTLGKASTEMAQQNLQFDPYIRVVQSGTPVSFPNKDDVAHHVYSFSPNHAFELELYKGREVPEKNFSTPGLVSLGCNIHDWMEGYIYVVNTPWFGQVINNREASSREAKNKGAKQNNQMVQIFDVPKGAYTLHFWHPGMDRKEAVNQTLDIQQGVQTVNLALSYTIKASMQPLPPEEQFDDASDY